MLNGSLPFAAVRIVPHHFGGLGNRIVGIQRGLLAAAVSDRLLLLDYGHFAAGSEVALLRPGLIKWDAQEWPNAIQLAARESVRHRESDWVSLEQALPSLSDRRTVTITLRPNVIDEHLTGLLRSQRVARRLDVTDDEREFLWRACAINALFHTSPLLDQEMKKTTEELALGDNYMGSHTDLFEVGLHLRSNNDFNDPRSRTKQNEKLHLWHSVAHCAMGFAQQVLQQVSATTPTKSHMRAWYVASDDEHLVEAFKIAGAAVGRRVLSLPSRWKRLHSGFNTRHLRGSFTSKILHGSSLAALIDLHLLAKAAVFVGSAGSSYSKLAAALAGARFFAPNASCKESCTQKPAIFVQGLWGFGHRHSKYSLQLPRNFSQSHAFCASIAGSKQEHRDPPLVVTFMMNLPSSKRKHTYNLSKTVAIRAPLHAYCSDVACNEILQARADTGHATTTEKGWKMARLLQLVAEALGVEEVRLLQAVQRSAGDRLHCRSEELVLIWLAKPILVRLAMNRFLEMDRFAWVDAGFNAYKGKRWKEVPIAPWHRFWPKDGIAVRLHKKCCKPLHIRPTRNASCVVGTYLYGSRLGWERFINAYVLHVAELVRTQDVWGSRSERLLCADQDIMADIVTQDPSLIQKLLPANSWFWHDITAMEGDNGI
eukprot:CAMPEP_0119306084 /NCGR_PEP_ID=MMETSP1333-20130426/6908_1 /TAXON_ID=418940 /ORGANISM="Scyphosphaera apsteinii, Strain RCC1455" /LENGTH=653 /DNA_ID=CAMNT_0007309303 /DNA_START=348 /DNA_END=2309 /DNA_ORIENTATION=-